MEKAKTGLQPKIRTKIMLWYVMLSVVLLSILVPAVYCAVEQSLKRSLSGAVHTAIVNIEACLYEENGEVYVRNPETKKNPLDAGIYLRIWDEEERVIYFSEEAEERFAWLDQQKKPREVALEWLIRREECRLVTRTVTITAMGNIYYSQYLYDLIVTLFILVPIYLLLAVAGSLFLAKKALFPIRQITLTAKAITAGELSGRIEGISSSDEVGELAVTFNSMLDELETSFQRERQFTSDASHELRTPLAVISASADEALHTKDRHIIEENLNLIQGESGRMMKIISQMLMLSRGYEGRCHFEPEIIALKDTVASVAEELVPMAVEKRIHIQNRIDGSLSIYADQSLFTQLMVNLIENAIKYGNEGGNVWLSARAYETWMKISVKDDGIGMAKEDLSHIFERFYRADKARDRRGSGLGLSIAEWVVSLHGGKITAASAPGEGTEFIVSFPIREGQQCGFSELPTGATKDTDVVTV